MSTAFFIVILVVFGHLWVPVFGALLLCLVETTVVFMIISVDFDTFGHPVLDLYFYVYRFSDGHFGPFRTPLGTRFWTSTSISTAFRIVILVDFGHIWAPGFGTLLLCLRTIFF